ncbi:replication factor-A carboxy-terminal domain protein [Trifolium pratense]|uniref:Replication factor-A carboxy-terminal domain protein n=1 Tax=Trifolium pratense TaxID=57577 RepID=A0A2K3L1F0_TRIPR|nr:replication factor-A carboxy-terminal domain protein [Trifolium pratense]
MFIEIRILGVSAGELRKNMLKDGVTNRLEYPETIDEMMGRTFAFRIKWQKEWKQGSVLECKDNKDLVGRIQKEFYDGMPINSTQTSAVNKILDAESSQVECSQSKPLEITDTLDDAPNVEEVSASTDFDPLQPTTLTPSKRSPVQQKDDDVIGGQQSSTRFIKTRSTKVMKTEKP